MQLSLCFLLIFRIHVFFRVLEHSFESFSQSFALPPIHVPMIDSEVDHHNFSHHQLPIFNYSSLVDCVT